MPSTYSSSPELVVYYGRGQLQRLAAHRLAVLQPNYFQAAELAELSAAGTRPLAYLALTEDPGPAAPWQRAAANPEWGGHYVDVGHPGWLSLVQQRIAAAMAAGFGGLLLDTLDQPDLYPDARQPLIELVRAARGAVGDGYILANRGYNLHDRLAPLVDGFLFEAFSTTWQGGYRALSGADLRQNAVRLDGLRATGRDLFLLDYAATPSLAAFARSRAATHGVPLQVADKHLTQLG